MTQAVIFDLDGTVLDNEGEWEEAFRAVARKFEIRNLKFEIPGGWVHEPGIGLDTNWKRISGKSEVGDLVKETVKEYSILNTKYPIKVRDGAEELIGKIKERGWLTALATSSTWFTAEKVLEDMRMYMDFDITTTGEEVMLLKPDPEIYLLTCQKLETDPESCLVIEDAIAGIRSAAEAGCKTVGLISGYATEQLLHDAGATYVANDMAEIEELLRGIE